MLRVFDDILPCVKSAKVIEFGVHRREVFKAPVESKTFDIGNAKIKLIATTRFISLSHVSLSGPHNNRSFLLTWRPLRIVYREKVLWKNVNTNPYSIEDDDRRLDGVFEHCLFTNPHVSLSEGKITFVFHFILHDDRLMKVSCSSQTRLPRNKLEDDLKRLFQSGKGSDMTIYVEKGSTHFRVHRAILEARSPVLADIFKQDMSARNNGVMNIVHCEAGTFKRFLEYLYTNAIDGVEAEEAIPLYELAQQYEVKSLTTLCLDRIRGSVKAQNFCDALEFALKHDMFDIYKLSVQFLSHHAEEIFATKKWEELSRRHPWLTTDLFDEYYTKRKSWKKFPEYKLRWRQITDYSNK